MQKIKKEKINLENEIGSSALGHVYPYGKKSIIKYRQTSKPQEFVIFLNQIVLNYGHTHPRVVPYSGYWIENEQSLWNIYIKMPKQHTNLSAFLNDRAKKNEYLSQQELVNQFYGLTHALEYLHIKNLAHCNIKSSNILLDENNKMSISDIVGSVHFNIPEGLTKMIPQIDNIPYTAPEVMGDMKKQEIFLTDVWSLGIVFLEICELKKFTQHAYATTTELMNTLHEKFINIEKRYGSKVSDLLSHMLSISSTERWESRRIREYLQTSFEEYIQVKFFHQKELESLAQVSYDTSIN